MLDLNPGLRSRTATVAALLMFSLVTGGWLLERGTRSGPVKTRAEAARLFDEVFSHVYTQYVDSMPPQTMTAPIIISTRPTINPKRASFPPVYSSG